jgi:hypothetical protein
MSQSATTLLSSLRSPFSSSSRPQMPRKNSSYSFIEATLGPQTMSFGFEDPKPPQGRRFQSRRRSFSPRISLVEPADQPSFRGVTFATLIVGPQHEYFHVHRNRLDAASVWFTKILGSGFEETATQRITLPEDDPSIVHLFVQWLYDPDPTFSVDLDEHFMQLARLFEFAQRLFIRQLKNYIIWQLFNLRSKDHIPPIPVVKFVFENLPDDSPFREVLVAWYAWHRDSARALTIDSLDALPQFTSALVIAMVNQRYASAKDPFSGSPDVYYESTDE